MAVHRCARCGTGLLKSQGGRVKMRLPLVAFRPGPGGSVICETPCPGCGRDAELPITLTDTALQKSMQPPTASPPGVRLLVNLVETPLTPAEPPP